MWTIKKNWLLIVLFYLAVKFKPFDYNQKRLFFWPSTMKLYLSLYFTFELKYSLFNFEPYACFSNPIAQDTSWLTSHLIQHTNCWLIVFIDHVTLISCEILSLIIQLWEAAWRARLSAAILYSAGCISQSLQCDVRVELRGYFPGSFGVLPPQNTLFEMWYWCY